MADAATGASTPSAQASDVSPTDSQTATAPVADAEPWKKVKHKIKVDGQESELDFDELVRRAQKGSAADRRLAEAAQMRKQLTEAWNSSDPGAYFKSKNMDPEQWAEQLLLEKMRRESMTPEQKKAYEKELSEKAQRDQEKRELEELRNKEKQYVTQQIVAKLDGEIVDAFKAINAKPNPLIVKRMAEVMDAYMEAHDGEMLPAAKALEQVMAGRKTDLNDYLQSLTAEDLRQVLPKKLLDELRRQDVELVRSQSPMRQASNGTSKPSIPQGKTKRTSTEEYFKAMEEKLSS